MTKGSPSIKTMCLNDDLADSDTSTENHSDSDNDSDWNSEDEDAIIVEKENQKTRAHRNKRYPFLPEHEAAFMTHAVNCDFQKLDKIREFAVATGSHWVAFPACSARWLRHYGGCCSGCRIFVARQPSTIFRRTSMQKAILESRIQFIQFTTLLKAISEEWDETINNSGRQPGGRVNLDTLGDAQ
ncbi:hypothetical protein B0H13DRAFT_2286201 [Mycena leptocephala]|nr:hypothetical protein B0H13DRAFT_2286201 [Mycena leptocephala]